MDLNTSIQFTKISYFNKLVGFSSILFFVKLILIPFVHEIDADAVSRVYLSLQFAENPSLMGTGNWPPIFFYIMGSALMVYENQFFTPVFINILFSVLLLFPLYFSLKRLFDSRISFLLCVFFSCSPIVFRMSMLAMSEISYLFFTISSISLLLKGIMDKKIGWVVCAGLLMGVAGGIRYESWMLGGLILLFIVFNKLYKAAFYFFIPFVIIPCLWIISNYLYADDALNSFNWAINLSTDRDINSFDSLLRRIWWYPFSLMIAFGPLAFYVFLKEIKSFKSTKGGWFIFISFAVFLVVWLVNSLRGSLLLQHRFSITLFLFSFSFVGFYFKKNPKNLNRKTIVFSASAFLLAFVYSSQGARPIPRLLTEDAKEVSEIINYHLQENEGFICDFWNWETTYYLPFATRLPKKNIEIIDDNSRVDLQIESIVKRFKSGVIVINKRGLIYRSLVKKEDSYNYESEDLKLELAPIFQNEIIICFEYLLKSQ